MYYLLAIAAWAVTYHRLTTATPRLAPLPCELTLDDLFFCVHALYVSTVLLPLTPYKMCFHLQRMFLCLQYSENSIYDRFAVSNTAVNLSWLLHLSAFLYLVVADSPFFWAASLHLHNVLMFIPVSLPMSIIVSSPDIILDTTAFFISFGYFA